MTYLGMYILTKLDSWRIVLLGSGWASLVIIGILLFVAALLADLNSGAYEKFQTFEKAFSHYCKIFSFRKVFITAIVFITLGMLLPTTKQVAFICIAPQIIENGAVKDTVKNIPELTKLGTDYLKELLKEKVQDVEQR